MRSNIYDLCDAFITALADACYAQKNIENYKQISNRFKRFCAENGYDTYTVNVGQMFADNIFNEKTGELVRYRYVMYGRFIRLINSFYLQGAFDFSMVTKEKNLPASTQLVELYYNYAEHLKEQYSNVGTVGFFQNGMLCLLRYMEKSGIPSLTDLAVADVVNYTCSWSQNHQRNVLCILRNIFQHFKREDLYFAVAGIHPYRAKRIVPMFTDNEIASIKETLSLPCVSRRDSDAYVLECRFPQNSYRPEVYLLSDSEIQRFFEVCDSYMLQRKMPGRPYVYPALYRFLYCCGARCGEARHLRCENVYLNDGYLDILQSKGHRDRRLFLSEELISYLKDYDSAIGNCFPNREYFFPSPSGNIISESSIPFNFRKIWLAAGLKRDGKIKPRPYDFRHHFACANIARWAQQGKDVMSIVC